MNGSSKGEGCLRAAAQRLLDFVSSYGDLLPDGQRREVGALADNLRSALSLRPPPAPEREGELRAAATALANVADNIDGFRKPDADICGALDKSIRRVRAALQEAAQKAPPTLAEGEKGAEAAYRRWADANDTGPPVGDRVSFLAGWAAALPTWLNREAGGKAICDSFAETFQGGGWADPITWSDHDEAGRERFRKAYDALLAPPAAPSERDQEANGPLLATVRLHVRADGGLRVWSEDVPGLVLSGADPEKVAACIIPALRGLEVAGAAVLAPSAAPEADTRNYPGGRTKAEWEPIAQASYLRAAELPDD